MVEPREKAILLERCRCSGCGERIRMNHPYMLDGPTHDGCPAGFGRYVPSGWYRVKVPLNEKGNIDWDQLPDDFDAWVESHENKEESV